MRILPKTVANGLKATNKLLVGLNAALDVAADKAAVLVEDDKKETLSVQAREARAAKVLTNLIERKEEALNELFKASGINRGLTKNEVARDVATEFLNDKDACYSDVAKVLISGLDFIEAQPQRQEQTSQESDDYDDQEQQEE